jgi:hypothetical protein
MEFARGGRDTAAFDDADEGTQDSEIVIDAHTDIV